MLYQIVSFLLEVASSLLCTAFLLRIYMQLQRTGFNNPVGKLVFALTDWAVLPLRRVLPALGRVDSASLLMALLIGAALGVSGARLSFRCSTRSRAGFSERHVSRIAIVDSSTGFDFFEIGFSSGEPLQSELCED